MTRLGPLLLLHALSGCLDANSSDTTSGSTPITGLKLPAEEIVQKMGCGAASGQVFKYAVFVRDGQSFGVAGLYDCFADAYFVNLPATNPEGTTYLVEVLAFDRASFDSQAPAVSASLGTVDPSGLAPTARFACRAAEQLEAQVIVRCDELRAATAP